MITVAELKKEAKPFWPGVVLERFFGEGERKLLVFSIRSATIIFGIFSFLSFAFLSSENGALGGEISSFNSKIPMIYGLFFVFLSLEVIIEALSAFYSSCAFLDIVSFAEDKKISNKPKISYEAASVILGSFNKDPILVLSKTEIGRIIFSRLGLSLKDIVNFSEEGRTKPLLLKDIPIREGDLEYLTLEKISSAIISIDKEFSVFLSSRKMTDGDFIGATGWAEHFSNMIRRKKRWWGRDSLGKIPGIGKQWAYGETPNLVKYATPIDRTPYYSDSPNILSLRRKEVSDLEKILSRVRGANALIVADSDEEAMGLVGALGLLIKDGKVMPSIENNIVYVLDHSAISEDKDKTLFESKLVSVLSDTIKAGNIIVVFKDFPSLLKMAQEMGSNIMGILTWYFNSADVHIIATANSQTFHAVIEGDTALMRYFEKILFKNIGTDKVLNYLRDEALRIEEETKVYFLFQALNEAAKSAERFFFGSNFEDKASDLLIEAATETKSAGREIVGREDVMRLVEAKTGIPRGVISANVDNEVLINLEKILSTRVVGQEEGIRAIGGAMRRARVGITNPNRPLGSFLFLGPTGVGKTETTKALADAFFGGESAIMRLDMSEYRTADALERLIGNFSINKPGILSSMLRDKPYGVLLLDEFEKTSKDVNDLFLQILDEGVFSDMSGKKVNARNLIIVATSNAGSDFIWRTVKEKGDGALNKDEVISHIINNGIFRPEFLNRFDGVVVFHPLGRFHLVKIAGLMLAKLNKRLAEKGLEVSVTPELINVLVEKGTDPTFGARPMNRAIQDKVETFVADKILRGEAPAGTKIVFTPGEIEKIRR